MFPWYSAMFHDWRSRANGVQSPLPSLSPSLPPPQSRSQTHSPYEPPSYDFDEDEARRDAQRKALAALTGGLLDSYLSGGRNTGRAFELQRHAYDTSFDRAREDADRRMVVERQRQQDEEMSAYRRKQQENIDEDNRRARQSIEAKSANDRELAERQARLVAGLPPDKQKLIAPLIGTPDFESGWLKVHAEPNVEEHWNDGMVAVPKPGGGYQVTRVFPEKPDAPAKPPTSAELRAQRSEEQRQIKSRTDELYDEWLAGLNEAEAWRISDKAKAQARIDARQRAEQELGVAPAPASAPAHSADSKLGARSVVEDAVFGGGTIGVRAQVKALLPSVPPQVRAQVQADLAAAKSDAEVNDILSELMAAISEKGIR